MHHNAWPLEKTVDNTFNIDNYKRFISCIHNDLFVNNGVDIQSVYIKCEKMTCSIIKIIAARL